MFKQYGLKLILYQIANIITRKMCVGLITNEPINRNLQTSHVHHYQNFFWEGEGKGHVKFT